MPSLLCSSNDLSKLACFAELVLGIPDASAHLYDKGECRKGCKMGHMIITANSDAELRACPHRLLQRLPGADADSGAFNIDLYAPEAPRPSSELSHKQPLVGGVGVTPREGSG
jgi:phosphoribosylaminoimidazole carboxylase